MIIADNRLQLYGSFLIVFWYKFAEYDSEKFLIFFKSERRFYCVIIVNNAD